VTVSLGYIFHCVCFNLYCGGFILFCNVCVGVCLCVCVWVGFVMCGLMCVCGGGFVMCGLMRVCRFCDVWVFW
jgi:hypothetical protein